MAIYAPPAAPAIIAIFLRDCPTPEEKLFVDCFVFCNSDRAFVPSAQIPMVVSHLAIPTS